MHVHAHDPAPARRPDPSAARQLAGALALTASFTVAEAIGGWISNSLALLADAGHMLTDDFALGLALFAVWSARRPPDPARTYGYRRAETLAALVNGAALTVLAGVIAFEAWRRLQRPPEVRYGVMAAVAVAGLVVNVAAALILHRGDRRDLNLRAAYLHVLGDLLGSVGALTAAAALWAFGWIWADAVAGLVIGIVIAVTSVRLVLEAVHVLMEGTPRGVDIDAVRRCLEEVPGVGSVHDLHLWSLSGGAPLLTAHLVADRARANGEVLRTAAERLREGFGIEHATLQVEPPDFNIVAVPGRPGPADPPQ